MFGSFKFYILLSSYFQCLITVVLQAKSTSVKIAVLEVLGTLAKSVAFHLFLTHDGRYSSIRSSRYSS